MTITANRDTTTVLNSGSGGDSLDESALVQADGSTEVKRARVDIGFGDGTPRGQLVDGDTPLPVEASGVIEVLERIDAHLIELTKLLLDHINS